MAHVLFSAIGFIFWIIMIVLVIHLFRNNGGRLYKSNTDRKLCGVCGGIAEALNVDATVVRLLWVIFTICGGSGILAYIIAAIIMPRENVNY